MLASLEDSASARILPIGDCGPQSLATIWLTLPQVRFFVLLQITGTAAGCHLFKKINPAPVKAPECSFHHVLHAVASNLSEFSTELHCQLAYSLFCSYRLFFQFVCAGLLPASGSCATSGPYFRRRQPSRLRHTHTGVHYSHGWDRTSQMGGWVDGQQHV